ncbi:MAG TPA: hypothetical protein VNO54_26640, partial [Streptosporangiaceae bacterium]|nr:hypothetical protein [Streptosporangiaceae bacterium]
GSGASRATVARLRRIALAGPPARQGQSHAGFTPIPRDQPVRRALAQPIRESARTPGTRPATLPSLPPQAAPEKTVMEVTRDAAGDRTPATSGEPAAAAFALRRRGA